MYMQGDTKFSGYKSFSLSKRKNHENSLHHMTWISLEILNMNSQLPEVTALVSCLYTLLSSFLQSTTLFIKFCACISEHSQGRIYKSILIIFTLFFTLVSNGYWILRTYTNTTTQPSSLKCLSYFFPPRLKFICNSRDCLLVWFWIMFVSWRIIKPIHFRYK